MNQALIQQYLTEYKKEFNLIHRKEIYKWRAVQHFQRTWRPDAEDFAAMLAEALAKTSNLLGSGKYFPRRMIKTAAIHYPESVRQAFADLYNEEGDLQGRIERFREVIKKIIFNIDPDANHYQDDRAILVYLNLRYPEDYYFYKFQMFKDFCRKLDYDYVPKQGEFTNIKQYFYVCQLLRAEIRSDQELLKLHKDRLEENEYFDSSFNILTQDVIYAITLYINIENTETTELELEKEPLILRNIALIPKGKKLNFTAHKTDHESIQRRNKNLGDLGEMLVLKYEKERCLPKFRDKVTHISVVEGDGLGYDILSFDEDGNEKYIEVKTTSGQANKSFFITANELEWSRQESDNYYLYRLFNYDETEGTAEFTIIKGDLTKYCNNPTQYEAILDVDRSSTSLRS